ncbi:uncharacterized protein LOC135705535 [Ochlerotatus camptorhynchus]|uniref:uncharacterized protein LOC135705535 n=1 Tax=Ochlerotatus camptorhynchus TaxID=644619 RepID=UPI0031D0F6D4
MINDDPIEEISIIVDNRLDDPNNIDERDHIPELEEIISEWKLDPAINAILETFFNPRDVKVHKKHPTGLIYDRFHNRNKKKFVQSRSSSDKETTFFYAKSVALKLSHDEIEKLTLVKNWLRNNSAPAEEVQQKWKETISLRLRSILNEIDVDKGGVLSEWPRILDDNGYLLIDSDFAELFGNPDKLFNNWDFFSQKFLDYVRNNEIKDDFSRQLLTALDESAIVQDGRDFIVCMVFQALIKPTRTSTRKLPTILQAQTDVCCICATHEEYVSEWRSLRREFETAKLQLPPRIFIVGSFDEIEGFYVVTGKIEYKLPTFLRCLDVIVKLKYVLNYQFPESCELFWCFVTRFFYNIDYKRKSKNNQLLQLIAYLETGDNGLSSVP